MSFDTAVAADSPLYSWGDNLAAISGGAAFTLGASTAAPTTGGAGVLGNGVVTWDGVNDTASATVNLSGTQTVVLEVLGTLAAAAGVFFELHADVNSFTDGFIVLNVSSKLEAFHRGNVGYSILDTTAPAAAVHLWHFVFDKTLSTNEVAIYKDGVAYTTGLARSANANNTNAFANAALSIGGRAGQFSSLSVERVAIYSSLSDARKLAHYSAAFPPSLKGATQGVLNRASTYLYTPNATITGTITFASTGTGTFSPSTLTYSAAADARAVTYTPTVTGTGTHTISVTNTASVPDPASVALSLAATTLLFPGTAWDGTVSWTGRSSDIPADPPRTAIKPIARFPIPPYQDVGLTDFTIAIPAYCKGGISSVTFWCEGNALIVTTKTVVTEYAGRDFEAYVCTLDVSAFPAGVKGPIDVTAYVTPTSGSAVARAVTLRLYRNDGTAPATIKYVAASGGSDGNNGNTSGTAYATMSAARDAIWTAQGNDAGGGIIYLLEGNHTYGASVENNTRNAANRWLTITPAPGTIAANVKITAQGSSNGIRTDKVRVSGVTVNDIAISSNSAGALWYDAVTFVGPGRTNANTQAIATGQWSEVYVTDSDFSASQYGITGTSALLYRNLTVHGVSSVAFQSATALVVCEAYGIDSTGTVFHTDVAQWLGPDRENILVYGLYGHDQVASQGFYFDGSDASDISDAAFVNCLLRSAGGEVNLTKDTSFDHLVFIENTFEQYQTQFFDESGNRTDTTPRSDTITNFAATGNVWQNLQSTYTWAPHDVNPGGSTAITIDGTATDYNFFKSGSTLGTHATTGTPGWDATTLAPTNGGNLLVSRPRITLIDAFGNTRNATNSAMGAKAAWFEYGAIQPGSSSAAYLNSAFGMGFGL